MGKAEQLDALAAEVAALAELVQMLVETQVAALTELTRIRQRLERAGAIGW